MFFVPIETIVATVKKQQVDEANTIEIKIIDLEGRRFFRLYQNNDELGDYKTISDATEAYYQRWAILAQAPEKEQLAMFK